MQTSHFFILLLLFTTLFFGLPGKTRAASNFCMTKTGVWWNNDREKLFQDFHILPTYQAAECDNGYFNPQCINGNPDWIFRYPTCEVIKYPCTYDEWYKNSGRCESNLSSTTCVWKESSCKTSDSCVDRSSATLNPGLCTAAKYNDYDPSTACSISSGDYKTCCTSQGTKADYCSGGDYTGTCPTGSFAKMCGVSQSVCDSVAPYPCTTASCGASACAPVCDPEKGTVTNECTSCSERTYYTTNCNGSKTPTVKPDSSCKNEFPGCISPKTSLPPPSPSPSPVELKCNQAYGGVCGCKPGTGCLDGESTDYRCCYRTCDKAAQACVTRAVAGAFPAGTLNNGSLNQCNDNSGCTGNYTGVCQVLENSAAFKVTGPPCSNCSYAKYTDGSFAWQGESVSNLGSFTHPVDAGKKFTWYINGKESSPVTCNVKNGQCGQEGCVTDDECDSDYQCEDVCQ